MSKAVLDWDGGVPARATRRVAIYAGSLQMEDLLDCAWRSGSCSLLSGAGVNDLLVTATGEARRILWYLAGWAHDKSMHTIAYSLGGGVRAIVRGTNTIVLPHDLRDVQETPPTLVLERLVQFIKAQKHHIVLVVDYIEGLVPHGSGAALDLGTARLVEQLGDPGDQPVLARLNHRLVLISGTGRVDPRLANQLGFLNVTVGLPDETGRADLSTLRWRSPPRVPCTWRRISTRIEPHGCRAGYSWTI